MSNPPPTSLPTLSLAILDDYASLAFPKFSSITPERLQITEFPNTLPATDHEALIARLHPFQIISTMRERTPLPAAVLSRLPNLKLLLTTGTRNASFDIPAATDRGIIVAGTTASGPPGFDSTTQHTWALILALAKNIPRDDRAIQAGAWQSGLNTGLAGKTLGILGLGRLGASVARIAVLAFGMRVLCWSSHLTQAKADELATGMGLPAGAFAVAGSKIDVCARADVLSLHYVLSGRSVGLVGAAELGAMKASALFVNTSRGALVDEGALLEVLREGRIRGAAVDVFEREPLPRESEWRSLEWGAGGRSQVVLTPHMGYGEEEVMERWYEEQAENVRAWVEGGEVVNRMN